MAKSRARICLHNEHLCQRQCRQYRCTRGSFAINIGNSYLYIYKSYENDLCRRQCRRHRCTRGSFSINIGNSYLYIYKSYENDLYIKFDHKNPMNSNIQLSTMFGILKLLNHLYFDEGDGPVCTRSASSFCRNPLNFLAHAIWVK